MSHLPFENTSVDARRSLTEVLVMLEMTGFDKTGQVSEKGHHTVIAWYKEAQFQFSVDTHAVVTALITNSSSTKQSEIRRKTERGKGWLIDFQEKAQRIAWRLMFIHVKALCDSIKLRVLTPAQAFAGNLVIATKDGKPVLLAEHITSVIETGDLKSPALMGPLMLEDKNK